MDRDVYGPILAARQYLYQMCQVAFGAEPNERFMAAFASPETEDAFDLLSRVDPLACEPAKKAWTRQVASWRGGRDAFLSSAKRDYMRLLIGPGELQAPPWECVYITKERMLLQEQTLRVRECYRAEGFVATLSPHVSDDHIAIELDFVAKLCEKSRAALEDGDGAAFARLIAAQREFVCDHMARWVFDYASDLNKEAPSSLYAAAGALCAALVHVDAPILEELEEAEATGDEAQA